MSDKISISVAGKVTHTSNMRAKNTDEAAIVAPAQEEKKTSTKKTKKVPVVEETSVDE